MKKVCGILLICFMMVGCSAQEKEPVEVKQNDDWVFSAEIKELKADLLMVQVIYGSFFDEVHVKIDADKNNPTYLFDPKTNTMELFPANLKVGDKVIIFYSGMATNSLPPQITANNIIWKLADDAPTDFREWKFFAND